MSTPPGLIARWPGDGTTGEVAHGRDGTAVGGTTYDTGKVGQAFSFDGTGTISVPDARHWNLNDDFTIDTWVNATSIAAHPWSFVGHADGSLPGNQPHWILWRNDPAYLSFYVDTGTTHRDVVYTTWTPTVGQWYHIAVTRSGTSFSLYIDGAVAATADDDIPILDVNGPLNIGSLKNDYFFNGRIDEPEIYQRALSAAEIKAIYDQGTAARCTPTSSSITLQTPATAVPGAAVEVTGNLSLGGAPASGASVEISRSVGGGAREVLDTVSTAPDGSYTYEDAAQIGISSYRASYAGDVGTAAEMAWSTTVAKQSASKLGLSASKSTVTYGDPVTITAHLKSGSPNRTVSIFATPAGGHKVLLRRGSVNGSGSLSVKTQPAKNTEYSATYKGDPSWKPDAAGPVNVKVAVRWSGRATGGYATSHGVRLYHFTTSCSRTNPKVCPSALFTLAPKHPGHPVYYFARYCRSGCSSSSGKFRLNRKSKVPIFFHYTSTSVIGVTVSVRFLFKGDGDHARAWSTYVRMRVTR